PFTSASGFVYDSGDYPQALALALELADYEGLKRERDAARGDGRLLGVGVSCYTEYTGIGSLTYRRRGMVEVPGRESARVSLAADGTGRCPLRFPRQGQGHATPAPRSVPDDLGLPLARVG